MIQGIRGAAAAAVFLCIATAATPVARAADRPGAFSSWDDEVYDWAEPTLAGSFIFGGVSIGMLIAFDQASRSLAIAHGSVGRPPVMSNLVSADHIPHGKPGDFDGKWLAQSYIYEYFFVFGMQGTVPMWGSLIPTLIAAGTGADLQTVKTVGCFAGGISMIATGVANMTRWRRLYIPEWQSHQVNEDGIAFVVPGIVTMFAGFADLAVAAVLMVYGVAYATGQRTATTEPGLFPVPGAARAGSSRPTLAWRPTLGSDGAGGLVVGISGVF